MMASLDLAYSINFIIIITLKFVNNDDCHIFSAVTIFGYNNIVRLEHSIQNDNYKTIIFTVITNKFPSSPYSSL